MPSSPNSHIPHRKSPRLSQFDYGQTGAYFVTICTAGHLPLLGHVSDGTMHLNSLGNIAHTEWLRSAEMRSAITLDSYVVMPNHIHGIIFITLDVRPSKEPLNGHGPSQTIGAIVRGFKGTTTRQINAHRGRDGVSAWQRNYYDHVIRNDTDLERIREYIVNNPARWAEDRFFAE